jgi:MYXO-CTERM domain-containing protein
LAPSEGCGCASGPSSSGWLAALVALVPALLRRVAGGRPARRAAALAAGGTDNGPPGIREVYHPAYYTAFALDPEGHNIEAVCFEPEAEAG